VREKEEDKRLYDRNIMFLVDVERRQRQGWRSFFVDVVFLGVGEKQRLGKEAQSHPRTCCRFSVDVDRKSQRGTAAHVANGDYFLIFEIAHVHKKTYLAQCYILKDRRVRMEEEGRSPFGKFSLILCR
jgi:hypothetical protein